MIADLNGWYLGTPTPATLAAAGQPVVRPVDGRGSAHPFDRHGTAGRYRTDLDAVANLGIAATWNGAAQLADARQHRAVRAPHHARRTVPQHQPRYRLGGIDHPRSATTVIVYTTWSCASDVTAPNFNIINNIGVASGMATVQLVACTPPHYVRFRWVTTARLSASARFAGRSSADHQQQQPDDHDAAAADAPLPPDPHRGTGRRRTRRSPRSIHAGT